MTVPMYLDGREPVFAQLHHAGGAMRGTGVVLCAPFGWEDQCSYRSRRHWADDLAVAGHAVMRLDLPGSGDSGGGPRDDDRLDAWTAAVGAAARVLRERGCARVAAVGIGLGGLVAWRAAALGEPVDDLALWAVPARARTLVREWRALARFEAGFAPGDVEDGAIAAAGYVISPQTRAELEALDLAALDLPDGARRRVLLFERDGREPDRELRAAAERAGAQVEVAPGDGFAEMFMVEPQDSRPSRSVLERIAAWLADAPVDGAATPPARPPAGEPHADLGAGVRERPLTLAHPSGDPFGVLAEPAGRPAAVGLLLLNAGPQRRTGPNRMWVEIARRWAARGVPSLRIDVAGIGDADGEDEGFVDPLRFYEPELLEQAGRAADALVERTGVERVLAVGLCVGGWWALQLALDHPRTAGAVMLNPGALVFEGGGASAVRHARSTTARLLEARTWSRLLRGDADFAVHARTARRALLHGLRAPARAVERRRAARLGHDALDQLFDRLQAADRRALIAFAGREFLYEQLERDGRLARMARWPNVTIEHEPVDAEVHTLRPLWLQRHAHALVDAAIAAELARPGAARAPAA